MPWDVRFVPVVSPKGGVGKTTIALLLAMDLARGTGEKRIRTALFDLDLEGTSLHRALPAGAIQPPEGKGGGPLHFLPWILDGVRLQRPPLHRRGYTVAFRDGASIFPSGLDREEKGLRARAQAIISTEVFGSFVLRQVAVVVRELVKQAQKDEPGGGRLIVFLDCGPGLSPLATRAFDAPASWIPKSCPLAGGELGVRRIVVSGPERQGLEAAARFPTRWAIDTARAEEQKKVGGAGERTLDEKRLQDLLKSIWLIFNRIPAGHPGPGDWLREQAQVAPSHITGHWGDWGKNDTGRWVRMGEDARVRLYDYHQNPLEQKLKEKKDCWPPLPGELAPVRDDLVSD